MNPVFRPVLVRSPVLNLAMRNSFSALLLTLAFLAPLAQAAEPQESKLEIGDSKREKPSVGAFEMGLFVPQFPLYRAAGLSPAQSQAVGLRLTGEWIPLSGWMGKLTLGLGAGYGKIAETPSSAFVEAFPLEATLGYRGVWWEGQLLVPYIAAGGSVTFLHQQFVPGMQRFKGLEWGGGLALNLSFLDGMMGELKDHHSLARHTYIAVDYRNIRNLGEVQVPDLSRDEIRVALRVEY
jgi:hypothetical protein